MDERTRWGARIEGNEKLENREPQGQTRRNERTIFQNRLEMTSVSVFSARFLANVQSR